MSEGEGMAQRDPIGHRGIEVLGAQVRRGVSVKSIRSGSSEGKGTDNQWIGLDFSTPLDPGISLARNTWRV